MPPKLRNSENKPYPKGWRRRKRGPKGDFVLSYRVPKEVRHLWDNKGEVELGRADTLAKAEKIAYQEWQRRIVVSDDVSTLGKLIDRYETDELPKKSLAQQKSVRYSIKRLRSVLDMNYPPDQFRPHDAYRYRDACAEAESPKKANLDLEVLSHLFTMAFKWGVPGLVEHPIKGKVGKLPIPSRDRYIEDSELTAFLSVCNPMLSVYVPLKYALGIDKSMMLRIKLKDIKPDCLEVPKRHKINDNAKAKPKRYPFYTEDGESTGLKELIEDVKTWRAKNVKVSSLFLFCTSQGQPFIKEDNSTSGFDSQWQRAMKKALEETTLDERFTEHDLCAKTASDVESLDHAAQLRGHINKATTHKTYRRKAETVLPLKTKK